MRLSDDSTPQAPDGGSETPEGARPSRKEREKESHRLEVFGAVEKLLERKSYGEISMEEIAAEAEFSVGYLYKLFSSKEDIFGSLIRIKHRDLAGLIDRYISEPTGVEQRLRNLIHGMFAWLKENPAYTSSSVRDLLLVSLTLPGFAAEFALWEAQYDAKTEGLLLEGVRAGVFGEEEDPRIMARTLRVLMKGFVQEDLSRGRERVDWTEYAPIVLRIFMRAFGPEGERR